VSKRIGIIGAGTAGLHLGLYLRQHDVDATIITDRAPEDYAAARLPNTVAHHAVTIEREKALGVDHWPGDEYGYFGHHYYIGLQPEPLRFYGHLHAPSRAVDYRIYQPRLLEDFAARGGKIEYRQVTHDDIPLLAGQFDLLVVCVGKGPFGQMFERQLEYSPFDRPQRVLCVGLFKGIAQLPTRAVTMYFSPGAGEMIEIPMWTFGGLVNALVIENLPGGQLEILAKARYDEDPEAFIGLLLGKLRQHYPTCAERIDEKEFDLANGPLDILQGGVTPTVRASHVVLDDGTVAIALGDVQATVDPVLGQGANMASHAGWILGEEIVAQDVFDERFVEHVEGRRRDRVLSATRWTNFMLDNLRLLPPEFQAFIGAVSQSRSMADEFTDNFNYPERQWDIFADASRVEAWIARHTAAAPASQPAAVG
jgi:2-polyprenyl-6-methoxyphenol hydroxylase-like FAD-dependent oxidoreductase